MINKSFGLNENFYSRQVLTILSIRWKLLLKRLLYCCNNFLFLFYCSKWNHCRSQIEHGSQTSLCHNCYATQETIQETNHQQVITGYGMGKCSKNHGNNKSMWCFCLERLCFHKFSWKLLTFNQREQSQFQLEMNVYCISWLRQISEFDCCSCPSNISFKFINCCSPLV